MGRLIVLCIAILSAILTFSGDAGAIIIGEVWSTGAYKSALDPTLGPPSENPEAYFEVAAINFNSLWSQKPKNITFDEFLNYPVWKIPEGSGFKEDKQMFTGNNQGDEGVFFRFTFGLSIPSSGSLTFTLVHDDGFALFLPTGGKPVASAIGFFEKPEELEIELAKFAPGEYTAVLNYGALNDTDSHVMIIRTPEPGSLLLLALGFIGIGVVRRRT